MEIEKILKEKTLKIENVVIKLNDLQEYDLYTWYGTGTIETKDFKGNIEVYIETELDNKTNKEIVFDIKFKEI